MRRSLRRGPVVMVATILLIGGAVALAVEKEKTPPAEPANPAPTKTEQVTYLGVGVEPIYQPLISHLPELLQSGQGVLVTSVAAGSPAEEAGIKPYDVLMTYGDQKLFSPEQLAKLVRADQAGREVTLSLVREGKVEQATATLAEHEVAAVTPSTPSQPENGSSWRLPEWQTPHWRIPQWFTQPTTRGEKDSHWQSFDSMTIKNLGDNRFKAEIQYLDKEGKMHRQEFEGTREEVHKAIMAQKDLPDNEREHLLRSLDLPRGELVIPSMYVIPENGFTWDLNESDGSL